MLQYVEYYLILGFVLNFSYIVWVKWSKPEQRPDTFLEVFVMAALFAVGLIIWPVAWWSRLERWINKTAI